MNVLAVVANGLEVDRGLVLKGVSNNEQKLRRLGRWDPDLIEHVAPVVPEHDLRKNGKDEPILARISNDRYVHFVMS